MGEFCSTSCRDKAITHATRMYSPGDRVRVWSNGEQRWFEDGFVIAVSASGIEIRFDQGAKNKTVPLGQLSVALQRPASICLRSGCGKPSWNGQPNEYCTKACKSAVPAHVVPFDPRPKVPPAHPSPAPVLVHSIPERRNELAAEHEAQGILDAGKSGDWDMALAMIRSKPSLVNARPGQRVWASIHRAAAVGRVDVLRVLIDEFGADLQLLSRDGLSPLEVAMRAEQSEAVAFLLETLDRQDQHGLRDGGGNGIKRRRRRPQEDAVEGPAGACSGEDTDEAEGDVEGDAAAVAAADDAARREDWARVFGLLQGCPAALAGARAADDCASIALLHQAARGGDLRIVQRLVEEFGAQPAAVDAGGLTAIEVAQSRGHHVVAAYLAPLTSP